MLLARLEYLTRLIPGMTYEDWADRVFISVSGLKKAIQSLENDFGYEIVDVKKTGVYPTLQGKALIECTSDYIRQLEEIKHLGTKQFEKLRIDIAPNILEFFASEKLARFSYYHPECGLQINFANNNEIIERLYNHESDIVLGALVGEIQQKQIPFKYKKENFIFISCVMMPLCIECHKDWIIDQKDLNELMNGKKAYVLYDNKSVGKKENEVIDEMTLNKIVLPSSTIQKNIFKPNYIVNNRFLYYAYLRNKCGYGLGIYNKKQDEANIVQIIPRSRINVTFGCVMHYKDFDNKDFWELIQEVLLLY